MEIFRSALLELPLLIAGHTYDTGAAPRAESGGDDGAGGIGTASIVAVLALTVVTVAVLVLLDPARARAKLKAVLPGLPIVAIVAAPLVVWASTSGGEEKGLIVERGPGLTAKRELIVSLGDEDLNTLKMTNGKRTVQVECLSRDGGAVLIDQRKWPFINERGYDYPHVHQPASREQLQEAARCRLRGTRVRLEAGVEGALTD
jgi:hypothetical protein